MEENQTPTQTPPSSEPKATATTDDKGNGAGSSEPTNKQAEAYRQAQSRADKANSEVEDLRETVSFLQEEAGERMKTKAIGDFLKGNAEKYPDVTAEDLEFATSEEDLERIATHMQNRTTKQKQDILASVREVPEESMTADEKEKALEKVRKSDSKDKFTQFLRIQSMKTRK